jgi:DNA-binding CsgD family transcriptional regulator
MRLPLAHALTQRQRAILFEVAQGSTNKLIAAHLGICEQTVKWHVSKMLRSCAVPNRAALVETMHDLIRNGPGGPRSKNEALPDDTQDHGAMRSSRSMRATPTSHG